MNKYNLLKPTLLGVLLATWWLGGCQPSVEEAPVEYTQTSTYYPQDDLDTLFHQIQMSGIFPDSKTFADAQPLVSPQMIVDIYRARQEDGTLRLEGFVDEYFQIPQPGSPVEVDTSVQLETHLKLLWEQLTRASDSSGNSGSLLPLPHPYVVPGGRFREIYYWDSYFTMLGLLESQQDTLMWNMLKNFAHLIDTHGFIPNGNRSYYLGRSQPPFFSPMVMLWAEHHPKEQALKFLPQMRKEYQFWMNGLNQLDSQHQAVERVLVIENGIILNRYWDNYARPRPESYREDFELASQFEPARRSEVYRDLRAGAESGWDYSSRWFSDGQSLDSIITTDIAPVDLNALMYFMEKSLSELYQLADNETEAVHFDSLSQVRAEAFSSYFWDQNVGFFGDYNFKEQSTTGIYSAAGLVPLYFKIATQKQADQCVQYLQQNLLFPGGVVSTSNHTGQQWDYPNGWAPQQWMTIQGLRHYGYNELADGIARRWVDLAEKVYRDTGKMMEKYNVVDLSLTAGGGEYPTQDGFGWTNGVTLALMAQLKDAP